MEVFVQVPLDRDAFEDDELREEDGSEEGDERRERDEAQGGSADGEAESEGGLFEYWQSCCISNATCSGDGSEQKTADPKPEGSVEEGEDQQQQCVDRLGSQ